MKIENLNMEQIYNKIANKLHLDFKHGWLRDYFETDVVIREDEVDEYTEEEIEECKFDWIHSVKENFLYEIICELHPEAIDTAEDYYEQYYDGCYDYLCAKTFERKEI